MWLPVGFLFIATWIFHSLTIEISDTKLAWHFGSGWPRKSVPLNEIVSAEPIRTSFSNGWGIHRTDRGWLYNVSGFGAVAITLRNGKQFCLGTDDPEKLAIALNSVTSEPCPADFRIFIKVLAGTKTSNSSEPFTTESDN